MIDLYTWNTPNGRKVSILLEELGVPYKVFPIDITKDEQFDPDFLKISPNNRIPAIVDHDNGLTLMESGAILLYLADKYDSFVPKNDYWRTVEWLMWQMGGVGPMFGQVHHFVSYNPGKAPYAETRYTNEAKRLYGILDKRLASRNYVAGTGRGEYSIADMAIFPWVARFDWQKININEFPNVCDWYTNIAKRPAVQKGYHIPDFKTEIPYPQNK